MNTKKICFFILAWLIILTLLITLLCWKKENFISKVYSINPNPEPIKCGEHPGFYFRSEIYQNICEPNNKLLRDKKSLKVKCIKTLSDNYKSNNSIMLDKC